MEALVKKRTEFERHVGELKTYRAELDAKKPEDITGDDREKFNRMLADGKRLKGEVEQLVQMAELERFNLDNAESKTAAQVEVEAKTKVERAEYKSWGARVIESKQFKENDRREMQPVEVKALFNDTDANGGYLVRPERLSEIIDLVAKRPKSVINLVNRSQTTVDSIEYIVTLSRTNNAAIVPERASGAYGLKPESTFDFDFKTAVIKTIATWIAASRQILQDAPRLRALIDNELTYMVEIVLEDQLLNGDGTGQNFTGIMSTSGINTRVHQTSGARFTATDTIPDTIKRALTDLALEYYEADAIVLHPATAEKLELQKDGDDNYLNVYDPISQSLWRKPVLSTQAIASGSALVGNFRLGCTLWDRTTTEIRVGEPNDYFLRNAVAVLAELRAGFAVTRPLAFEKITGL
jgi:HK97 family phage major capsid protein